MSDYVTRSFHTLTVIDSVSMKTLGWMCFEKFVLHVIVHIFRTTQTNQIQFSNVIAQSKGVVLFGTPCT